MMSENEIIGTNFKRLREQKNIKQEVLAERMNKQFGYSTWSRVTVGSIESGKRSLKITEAKDALTALGYSWKQMLDTLASTENDLTPLEVLGRIQNSEEKAYAILDNLAHDYALACEKFGDHENSVDIDDELEECVQRISFDNLTPYYNQEIYEALLSRVRYLYGDDSKRSREKYCKQFSYAGAYIVDYLFSEEERKTLELF